MSVPDWVKDSIFYQIFPDRFNNGDKTNDPDNIQPWGAQPTITGFQGGDFRGIIDRMYYLVDLGINAIYLNPVFLSSSNHRYNTTDYYQIDPKLGTMKELKVLLDVAHRNHIRLILDGVFNHCGRGFFAFNDILENQSSSPYISWFHINKFPVDAYSPGNAKDYEAWWKFKSLPKFNTGNPKVRKYIFDVARYWIEQGIDGWRLDVPSEIDDDSFWAKFHQTVKDTNPDAYLVGEIWDGNPRWIGDAHFDGLMDYPVRTLILDLLSEKIKAAKFTHDLVNDFYKYPQENAFAMYVLLGSHDTERFFTMVGRNVAKAKLGMLIQFAFPGAPAVYYGDDIGLDGGKDPECRKAFNWDEGTWNTDLHQWVKTLAAVRKNHEALRRGNINPIAIEDGAGAFGLLRDSGDEKVILLGNASAKSQTLVLDLNQIGLQDQASLKSLTSKDQIAVQEGKISVTLAAWSGMLLEAGKY
jgi:glycosidase